MELYNNYWKMILNEIPSKGLLYSDDTIIKIRPLNVQETKYLSTLCDENAVDIINEILYKCLNLTNLNFEDILLCDREYFIFWLRNNSFIQNSGYELNYKCHECNLDFTANVKLTDFKVKYLNNDIIKKEIYLKDAGITLKLKQPTIKELSRNNNDNEIQTFLRYIDIDKFDNDILSSFLEKLSALDYSLLKSTINEMTIGFDKDVKIYCTHCNHEENVSLLIKENGLFSTVNMFEIMEGILKIAKYTQFQIPETMPWWEVEIAQKVAEKMSDEEQQQIDKNNGKITMKRSDL